MSVRDILQEEFHFLVGNDVADVLGIAAEFAEGETDHLVVRDGRTAAVAGVDRGIHLDAQARYRIVVRHELDPRDDALGDGQRIAAGREAIGQHGILDVRQLVGALHGRMRIEERGVVQLQNREVDAGSHRHDRGRHLVAGRARLHLDLAGVQHDVCVGENAVTLDHDAGPGGFGRCLLGPGLEGIGVAHGREDLDHRVLDVRRRGRNVRRSGVRGGRQGTPCRQEPETGESSISCHKDIRFGEFICRRPSMRAGRCPAGRYVGRSPN